jgi:hypothetical protein
MQDGTKIIGRYILAFVKSTGDVSAVFERKTREIFEKNGLDLSEISEDTWHDANQYADAMHEIKDEVGKKTLQQAGAEQAANVPWPDNITSVADGMEFLVKAEKDAHKVSNGRFSGNYDFEMTGESSGRVSVADRPSYPTDNYKGVFRGAAKDLSDSSSVRLSDVDPRSDERAAFEIRW